MDINNQTETGAQPKARIKRKKKGLFEKLPSLMSQRSSADPKALMRLPKFVEERSSSMLRLVGYVLLILAFFDVVAIVLPPRLLDPVWEFQTIGQLVERVPVPLLGFLLVFYRHETVVEQKELSVMKWLSWLSLAVGIFYFLMVPLGIFSSLRIYDGRNAQIDAQRSQQSQQVQRTKEQLSTATDKQLSDLISGLNRQGRSIPTNDPDEFRKLLLNQLEKSNQDAQIQADFAFASQGKELIKNSIKWNLGAIIGGFAFVWMWRLTHWARSPRLVVRVRQKTQDLELETEESMPDSDEI